MGSGYPFLPGAKQDSEQRTGRKWGRLEENPVLDKSVTQALQWIRAGPLTERALWYIRSTCCCSVAPTDRWAAMMARRHSRGTEEIPLEAVERTEWMGRWMEWVGENRELAGPNARDSVTIPHSLFISKGGGCSSGSGGTMGGGSWGGEPPANLV